MVKTQTEIKSILASRGLSPNKQLGQNFLCDANIIQKIISCIDPNDTVIEIGAGLGNLTTSLAVLASRVHAVELDKGYAAYLFEDSILLQHNVTVYHHDILKLTLSDMVGTSFTGSLVVVGNIPYYISGPILFWMLSYRQMIRKAVMMMQTEVAERIMAAKDTKNYGKLTVLLNCFTIKKRVCHVSRQCFYPAPNVDSTILEFTMRQQTLLDNDALFFFIIKKLFSQRRKTIKHSLQTIMDIPIIPLLKSCGIDPKKRPENMDYTEYVELANAVHRMIPPHRLKGE